MKKFPSRSSLLTAGVQNRPDTSVPLSSHQGTTALRDPAVNDQLPDTLLATIVGWRNRGIEQESKNCVAVFTQTSGQRCRFSGQVVSFGQGQHPFFYSQHTAVKLIFGNLIALMPKTKQLLKLHQQSISKGLIVLVWQRGQKLNITNQMCQTKLLKLVGVFDIGTEKVTYDGAAVGFSLVLVLFAAVRERVNVADVPAPFKGNAIALITAGLMSMAFMGFAGLVSG